MQISTLLDHIDSGHIALPVFQRGYVWNRDQVRALFDSLYRRHPVGSLLVWVTESKETPFRGDGQLPPGTVRLLLDGQQRMTTVYGVARGRLPRFFDGNPDTLKGLRFHLEEQTFEFYQPVKMRDDPLWVDVTTVFKRGSDGLGDHIERMTQDPALASKAGGYAGRLLRLLGILEIDLHVDELTGQDKSVDVVVDIFNRVNSGGTKLSKGDLALAKISAAWPEARDEMKRRLKSWENEGYRFNLDWLLRSVNTVLTGEAKFQHLHDKSAEEVRDALERTTRHIETSLNMISGRLGLDHDRVLFGKFAIPVMVRYLAQRDRALEIRERDRLLFWYAQAGMWGRFSGSTESVIDQDLAAIESSDGKLDGLLEQLRLWHGGLRVEPGHFTGWSLGARFYPVLYMLTRMGEARDWGTGLPLRSNMLGKMNRLEVHHVFPKTQLYKRGFKRPEVNAVANYCFLTKDTNLSISDRLPEEYFPAIEARHPGALTSQWIPMDEKLWRIENYLDFLEARKVLLAEAANSFMTDLLHGETRWLEGAQPLPVEQPPNLAEEEEPEAALEDLNAWVEKQGLPRGLPAYDLPDPDTGQQLAVLDMAWPEGLQEDLSEPVALVLNGNNQAIAIASQHGFRCFADIAAFKQYVQREILALEGEL